MGRDLIHWKRRCARLVLFLHLLVVGLAPVVDAYASDAGQWEAFTHVEARRDTPCAPAPHDHLFCQTCRVVDHAGLPTAVSPALFTVAVGGDVLLPAAFTPSTSGAPLSALRPRAPPALS